MIKLFVAAAVVDRSILQAHSGHLLLNLLLPHALTRPQAHICKVPTYLIAGNHLYIYIRKLAFSLWLLGMSYQQMLDRN